MEANYACHNFYNEYKTRNILSLAERVEVIREYDRHLTRPSLQSLAQRFECSSKQIKNILINRESILESFRNGGEAGQQKEVHNTSMGELWHKRQEKIAFLGKVMYEYIQRMVYFNQNIDDQKFRQKALQIKECIAVENFQPTNAWLENFKATYGIPAFDLNTLRNNIVLTEAKRPHLSAIDMIQFVSRREQELGPGRVAPNRQNGPEHFPKADILGNGGFDSPKNRSSLEPKIIYEIEDEEDEELKKLNFDHSTPKMPVQNNSTVKRRSTSPFPDIESIEDALKHVKALEEYAMMQDNFRAIGLLTQLEQIFRKKSRKQ